MPWTRISNYKLKWTNQARYATVFTFWRSSNFQKGGIPFFCFEAIHVCELSMQLNSDKHRLRVSTKFVQQHIQETKVSKLNDTSSRFEDEKVNFTCDLYRFQFMPYIVVSITGN